MKATHHCLTMRECFFAFLLAVVRLPFIPGATAQVTWQQSPFPVSGIEFSALNMDDDNLLVAGFTNALWYSWDNGTFWTQCANWPGYFVTCIDFTSTHVVFIGTLQNGIYRSTDGCVTVSPVNSGLTWNNIWCLAVLDNDHILAGTPGGMFRSADNGASWSPYGAGLPADEIKALSVGDDGKLYAGTMNHGIYRSTDNGANWIEANSGLPSQAQVTALLAVHDFQTVYAGLFPYGAYMSVDDGITWIPYNNGLPFSKQGGDPRNLSISDIISFALVIFLVIFDLGVYQNYLDISRGPNTWFQVNAGLPPDPHVNCLIRGPDAQLFLGASDQGLYTNAYPVNIAEPAGQVSEASVSVAPNPFGECVTFTVRMPRAGVVSIRITDMVGKEAYFSGKMLRQAGEHRFEWAPAVSGPGIYLYTAKADEEVFRGKIVSACR